LRALDIIGIFVLCEKPGSVILHPEIPLVLLAKDKEIIDAENEINNEQDNEYLFKGLVLHLYYH